MPSPFFQALKAGDPGLPQDRTWWYLAYDQLHPHFLPSRPGRELGVVLIEWPGKAARRPYHRQKLALLLANQRHFALELLARGIAVDYRITELGYSAALIEAAKAHGTLRGVTPAERELRQDLAPALAAQALYLGPHPGWLTTAADFEGNTPGPPWRLDTFYRRARQRTGLLMDGKQPLGGRYSFDTENRRPWKGTPPAPRLPNFVPDAITREVGALIEGRYAHHPGALHLEQLPSTAADAETLVGWFLEHGLPHFGPYEDAMSRSARTLFHSRLSGLLNLHRVWPRALIDQVVKQEVPLSSKEGFLRQVLGWREFVRHVHQATDGFRRLPEGRPPVLSGPGDAGFGAWAGRDWPRGSGDGGACPSHLGAARPLPSAYWGTPSGLACLDDVVRSVWDEGYSHHITRLMVLANLGTLLDVDPRALTDWFWVAYQDAYDWVVEPNVLGMGTFAAGPLMTTKPYVSGAAYLAKMSDHCGACRYDPKKDCPITSLYWAFLGRHQAKLKGNPRLQVVLAAERNRRPEQRAQDQATFERTSAALSRGERLD